MYAIGRQPYMGRTVLDGAAIHFSSATAPNRPRCTA